MVKYLVSSGSNFAVSGSFTSLLCAARAIRWRAGESIKIVKKVQPYGIELWVWKRSVKKLSPGLVIAVISIR